MGEMSTFTSKLSSYSMTQLNELLEDDDKLSLIVNETEEMQEIQRAKDATLTSNRTLAEQNLILQPELNRQKNQLTNRYRCLHERLDSYQLRKSTLDQSGNGSLDTLLALLQAEGAKIEEESENMADSFLDGEVSLDMFVDDYHTKRKLAHLRRVKIDKLQELVLKGHRLPQATPTPPQTSPYPGQANGTPVPLPRRAPPLPPVSTPTPQESAGPLYPLCPYPVLPTRMGVPMPGMTQGYPSPLIQPYPPALPHRPSPRAPQHTGFIMQ